MWDMDKVRLDCLDLAMAMMLALSPQKLIKNLWQKEVSKAGPSKKAVKHKCMVVERCMMLKVP